MMWQAVFRAVLRRALICVARFGLQRLLGPQADVYIAACEHYLRRRKRPAA